MEVYSTLRHERYKHLKSFRIADVPHDWYCHLVAERFLDEFLERVAKLKEQDWVVPPVKVMIPDDERVEGLQDPRGEWYRNSQGKWTRRTSRKTRYCWMRWKAGAGTGTKRYAGDRCVKELFRTYPFDSFAADSQNRDGQSALVCLVSERGTTFATFHSGMWKIPYEKHISRACFRASTTVVYPARRLR